MSLSHSENINLACPSCGQRISAEVWALVDAAERPDLAAALHDETLNVVVCPHCGYHGPAGAALLFHDPGHRRVYFAVPAESEEYAWREQAQSLLYQLVAALPEEQRLPYLGDVLVEQDVAGVRRAVLRRQGARRPASAARSQQAEPVTHPQREPRGYVSTPQAPDAALGRVEALAGMEEHSAADEPPSPLIDAARRLLAADSPEEFVAIVDEHPALLSAAADATLAQLAEIAAGQAEHEVAEALGAARTELARMRKDASLRGPGAGGQGPGDDEFSSGPQPSARDSQSLSDKAYQALLMVTSLDELRAATSDHPALLDDWTDADLSARVEAALDAGDERLAVEIEERREVLAALRAELSGQESLPRAIKALLHADGEDALAETLTEHPILLTHAAQAALADLAAAARARGDDQLAGYATERRAMLRKVREGLEAA